MGWVSDFCENTKWDQSEFSDLSLTGETPCFEDIVLAGSVQIAFLVLVPVRLYQLKHTIKLDGHLEGAFLQWVKTAAIVVNWVIPILFLNGIVVKSQYATFELVSVPLDVAIWVLAMPMQIMGASRFTTHGTWIPKFLYLFAWAADAVRLRTKYLMSEAQPDLAYFFILYCIAFGFLTLLLGATYFVQLDHFKAMDLLAQARRARAGSGDVELASESTTVVTRERAGSKASTAPDVNPEERASCVARWTFGWLTPLIRAGYKAPLQFAQIWSLPKRWASASVNLQFSAAWEQEQEAAKKATRPPSLVGAFRRSFGRYFASAGLYLFVQNLFQYLPPVLLRAVIEYVQERDGHSEDWKGYLLGLAIFVCLLLMSLCENQYFDRVIKTGMGIRAGLVTTIYRHALRMSNAARQERSVGAITNHMTSDAERIQLQCVTLHNLWSSPLRIILGMYLLFDSPLRASVLAGVALLLLLIPAQVKVMGRMARLLKRALKEADARVKVVNEILQGMLVIKYYAWENSFLAKTVNIRGRELKWLRSIAITRGIMLLLIGLNPVALAVGTFGAFALVNGNLDAGTAFFALSLFNLLFWPILLLPRTISMVLETKVSISRIEGFLACDTLKDNNFLANDDDVPDGTVSIVDGTFFWDKQPVLQNITLNIEPGKLVAVIGHTGSGKSSLLNALLREMGMMSGQVGMKGSVAYVAQQAWIFNDTVQGNILFGLPNDPTRYLDTVTKCCLLPDFDQFGLARDQTEIGEKGVNLSGGQRQRISVARAVYADAQIYLFDDPLSALDAKVGSELFHKCIRGYLDGKTRVLVTNQLQYMPEVDHIVVLDEGRIVEHGSYHELMAASGKLSQLMADMGGMGGDSDGDEAEAETKGQEETTGDEDGGATGVADVIFEKAQAAKAAKEVETAKEKGKLVTKEHRETGSLDWSVYTSYIRAAGGWKFFIALMMFYIVGEVSRVSSSYWLGVWSSDSLDASVATYMGVYFALSLAQTLLSACSSYVGAIGSVEASRVMHLDMISTILRAPMQFFVSTPVGRIVNRFTKDISQMDTQLMFSVSLFLGGVTRLFGTFIIIAIVSPYAIMTFVPVMFLFYFVQRLFRASSRELKRLDSISRSPVYAHFTETLDGMATIRAFHGATKRMVTANERKLDRNQAVYIVHMSANRWLSVRLEFLGGLMILGSAIFSIMSNNGGELVGLSLSYALTITSGLNMVVRMSTETENAFNAVERVEEYTKLEQEAPAITRVKPDNWPSAGRIEMENVTLRYRKGGEKVLNNLSLTVQAGHKVGVAGRTGAGKSTLFQALFRIAEIEEGGSIKFDGQDISKVGLETLRKNLAIIPQNPVLYSGTVRTNLDPFKDYEDEQLWDALGRAQLRKVVSSSPGKLDMPVTAGGENFSVGQRQLICLARALLRKSKILVVDEATANVDMETDALIQQTIREQFADVTTLTIAHRLNTIVDSDMICILGAGQVLEYDTPKNLLSNPDSEFSSMVAETGHHNEQYLRSLVLDDSALAAMTKEREELAARADIASNLDNLMHGPLASNLMSAFETVRNAIADRHGPAWQRELRENAVSDDVWLAHLYQLLDDLHKQTEAAMQEDDFDLIATENVREQSMVDSNLPGTHIAVGGGNLFQPE